MGVNEIDREQAVNGRHRGSPAQRGSTRIWVSKIITAPCTLWADRERVLLAVADPDGQLKPVDPLPPAARQAFERRGTQGDERGGDSGGTAEAGSYSLIAAAREAGDHILELLIFWPTAESQTALPQDTLRWLLEPPDGGGFRRLTMHESHLRALGIAGSCRGDGELSVLGIVEGEETRWMVALLKITRPPGFSPRARSTACHESTARLQGRVRTEAGGHGTVGAERSEGKGDPQ